MSKPSIWEVALRFVLALVGAAVVYTGVNIAGGGIATLGLQGGTEFFAVTDHHEFAVHDSHVRFLGGLLCAQGKRADWAQSTIVTARPVTDRS